MDLDVTGLETLVSKYDPVIVHDAFCVRERSGTATCHACVQFCPREAISFTPQLHIDFTKCDSCMVCVALCPTGVYADKKRSDVALLREIRERLNHTSELSFHCTMPETAPPPIKTLIGNADDMKAAIADDGEEVDEAQAEAAPEASATPDVVDSQDADEPAEPEDEPDYSIPSHPQTHIGAVKVSCLGRVADAIMVGAIVNGAEKIWMDPGLCDQCWRRNGYRTARSSAKYADGILSMFGMEDRLTISAEPSFDVPPPPVIEEEVAVQSVAAVDVSANEPMRKGWRGRRKAKKELAVATSRPSETSSHGGEGIGEEEVDVSRRAFFSGMKKSALQTGAVMIDQKLTEVDELTRLEQETKDITYDRRLPVRHSLMVGFMQAMGEPLISELPASQVPFAQMEVSESCTFCGQCEQFCPTEAVAVVDKPKKKLVGTLSALCVDCGLCADICPPEAISFKRTIDVPLLVSGKVSKVLEGKMAQCKECKQEFFSVDEKQTHCTWCELRKQKLGETSFQ